MKQIVQTLNCIIFIVEIGELPERTIRVHEGSSQDSHRFVKGLTLRLKADKKALRGYFNVSWHGDDTVYIPLRLLSGLLQKAPEN